jgi:hypothetical protein
MMLRLEVMILLMIVSSFLPFILASTLLFSIRKKRDVMKLILR